MIRVCVVLLILSGCANGGSHKGSGYEPLPPRNLNHTTQCDQGGCRDSTVDYFNNRGMK